MEKEGFGEEFSICSSFCFGGIRGGQKNTNSISTLCFYHSTIFRPRSKGVHPRHSPRTFPLGLLAPRCLGLALLLAIARLRAGGSGAMLFGRRNRPPGFGLLLVPSESALAQPPSTFSFLSLVCMGSLSWNTPLPRFQDCFRGVASASDFCIAR